MTVKGLRNHYNVKLLRGYGTSINVKVNQLILKNGLDPITQTLDQGDDQGI